MSRFLTPLVKQHVGYDRNGWPLWELREVPLVYESSLRFPHPVTGRMMRVRVTAPLGFRTNLISTPRTPILFSMFGDKAHAESATHDLGYSFHGPLTKDQWDLLFRESMAAPKVLENQNDMPGWQRELAYQGVSILGGTSFTMEATISQHPEVEAYVRDVGIVEWLP